MQLRIGMRLPGTVVDIIRQKTATGLIFRATDRPAAESMYLLADGPGMYPRVNAGESGSIVLRPGGPTGAHWQFVKPWPKDALMIVAANKGEELRERMQEVTDASCRLCQAALAVDAATILAAQNLPSRHGRPVQFFCIPCAAEHDFKSITELHMTPEEVTP